MTDLIAFFRLGVAHIVSVQAVDHILFLLALAAIYRPRDWRDALWVISSFTIGHSVTLALAVTGAVHLPTRLIEFLIPVTIVATCVENVLVRDRSTAPWRGRYRPVFAGIFGLVHGAGFANYLSALFIAPIALPLLGFNLGIEAGQVVVLGACALALVAFDAALSSVRRRGARIPVLRVRILAVSVVVAAIATRWAIARSPW